MSDVSGIPERSWEILDRYSRRGGSDLSSESPKANGHSNGTQKQKQSGTGTATNGATSKTDTPIGSPTGTILEMALPHQNTSTQDSVTHFTSPSSDAKAKPERPLILIIDILWPTRTHPSHFNFPQALTTALRLNPSITYGMGYVHPTTHFMWEELGLSIRGLDGQRTDHPDSEMAEELVKRVWADKQFSSSSSSSSGGKMSLGKRLKEWGGRVEPSWDGLGLVVGEKGWRDVPHKGLYF